MVSAPRAELCQLHILPDLEDTENGFTPATFLKMRSLAKTSKSRKICFLLMCRLGEFSLQIFCGFIKLNQKESLNRSIALGNCFKSQLAGLAPWGIANLPSSPLGRLYLLSLLKVDPGTCYFQRHSSVVQPQGTSRPARWMQWCIISSNSKGSIKVIIYKARAKQDFWLLNLCTSGMVCLFLHGFIMSGGKAIQGRGSLFWI